MYVKEGSVLNLTCVFSGHVTNAEHIFRYRGHELLNSATRGGVNIISNKVDIKRLNPNKDTELNKVLLLLQILGISSHLTLIISARGVKMTSDRGT